MWKIIRSFGLDYDDFPSIMNNVAFLLRIITIDIYKNSKPIPFISYITTSIAGFAYLYTYMFSMIWMVLFYYGKTDRWTEASVVLSLGLCSFTCVTKFVFMKLYAKDIKETVDQFLKSYAQVTPETRLAINLKKKLRIIKRRAVIIWITFIIDVAGYLSMPYVRPGRHFTTDLYVIYGLTPMFESPNFEIATCINILCILSGIYTMLSTATYFIVAVGFIEAQLLVLSEELQNIWNDSENLYNVNYSLRNNEDTDMKETKINENISEKLRDIIKCHIENIDLLHKLNYSLRPILAFEFCILGFAITAELLGGLEHTYLQIPYTVVQLYMDCLAGQRLIEACSDFEDSVYSCNWENFNVRNQKTVLIMLTMSQRPLDLSAGGVASLDYECLMSILKSTYTAYTTLKSTVK